MAEAARKRKVRLSGLLKATIQLGLVVAGLGVAVFFMLTRSHPGQAWLLDRLVQQVSGRVNGTISVADVRSDDILKGARLFGVSIHDPDGRPFLEVDSLDVGYRALGFLAGQLEFSRADVHGPRVRIATLSGEAQSNLETIFGDPDRPGNDSTDTSGLPSMNRIVFRDVRLIGGSVELLQPLGDEPPERASVVDGPDGRPLRRIAATGIVARLPRVVVSLSRGDVDATVASLGLDAWIFEDPLQLVDLRGTVAWADGVATVSAESMRLPGSEMSGVIRAEVEGPRFTLDLETPALQLDDVAWIEPRVPSGVAQGAVGVLLEPGRIAATLRGVRADFEGDHLWADGVVSLEGSRLSFDDLAVRVEPLGTGSIESWTGVELPVDGHLEGSVTLTGPSTGVRMGGRFLYTPDVPGEEVTSVALDGVVRSGAGWALSGMSIVLDPLDYATVARALGDTTGLGGRGRATLEVTGSPSDSLLFTADLEHEEDGLPTSRVVARGVVRPIDGDLVLNVDGEVAPLSFTTLGSYGLDLPVSGEITGSVAASGRLSELHLGVRLDTELGRMDLEADLNAKRLADPYRVAGRVDGFPLGRMISSLPEPSVVSGTIALEGRGLTADSVRGEGRLRLSPSVVGPVPLDTVRLDFRVGDGGLSIDTLEARAVGLALRGGGWIPFREGDGEGELNLEFDAESLEGLRALVRGDTVVARDTLSALQMELLAATGVDIDTLPALANVAVGGRVRGDASVRGSLESFGAVGAMTLEDVVWGTSRARLARFEADASGLPGADRRIQASLVTDSLGILGRGFSDATAEIDYEGSGGSIDVHLVRSEEEDYRLGGVVTLDSLGGRLALERLDLRFDTTTWSLSSEAAISWNDAAIEVQDLVVTRPGSSTMRLRASGLLPRTGDADFTLDIDGLPLPRLTRLAQREDLDLQGVTDMTLRVTGRGASPIIHGDIHARDVSYATWDLDQLLGSFDYGDLRAAVDLRAWRGDLQVLQATGTIPVDLSFGEVADRIPDDRAMDVRVVADSLPAAFAVTLLEALEDVQGTISGDFRIGGTLEEPSPAGTMTIRNAAWTVVPLGVRQNDVQGQLVLRPDGTMDIDATARSGGTARVTGTIDVEPLDDPGFDLLLRFNGFQAIDRRDMAGIVSGEVALGGRFREPLVEGLSSQGRGLTAVGDLYVEEFARSGLVVDLSDPRFSEFVNQDLLTTAQPIIAESQNPFMNALRVNVDVTVGRGTWLRSGDMNVEIGGNLRMNYNREQRDLALSGELQAIRGSYSAFGRRFDVRGGTVEFVGTPGVNPNLSIEAVTRVRRADGEPLDITATLSGTLTEARVQLSSEEQAIAPSDLMSYLAFGRPSYELTSGQAQGVQEASALLDVAGSVGSGFVVGTLTNRISSLLGQRFGLDYFAINPGSVGVSGDAATAAWSQTTVELGGYLGEQLFWALTLRPAGLEGSNTLRSLPGVRLEWQPTDLYRIEAFIDDRFLRSGAIGFRELGFQPEKVYGLNLFREWTY